MVDTTNKKENTNRKKVARPRSVSNGVQAPIYNIDGKETGKITLPESVFGVRWNADLVHQVTTSYLSNKRTGLAHTKDRSEVRGGGKKPWRQKGTGRARHGSSRSPIWRGGGVTFGPRSEKDYSKKINRKMKAKALYAVLSKKLKDDQIIFVDELTFNDAKTKQAKDILKNLSGAGFEALTKKKKNAALIALPEYNVSVMRSFDNLGNVTVDEIRNLTALDVLNASYVIIPRPEEAIAFLEKKMTTKETVTA